MLERINDLSDNARRVLFAIVTVFLIGIAVWAGARIDAGHESAPADQPAVTGGAQRPAVAPVTPAPPAQTPAPATPAPSSSAPEGLEMPVASDRLDEAAATATEFARQFVSYRYDQPTAQWMTGIQSMLSSEAQIDLNALVPTGPSAERLQAEQRVVVATAQVSDVLLVAESTVTLAVHVTEHITTTSGETSHNADYEITLISSGSGWGVQNIVPRGGG